MKNSTSLERISNNGFNIDYNSIKDQALKYGYLKKLGGKGISKNWKKRFFILTKSGIFYYFKHRTSKEPVGIINLEEYTKIYKDKSKKKYFLLVNENNPQQRIFHLIADSEEEMELWITEITEFFNDDINDLKNQLSNITKLKTEKKKYDTITKNAIKAKRVEEYDLEKLQLVFKGERLSLLIKDPQRSFSISKNSNGNDILLDDSALSPNSLNGNNNNNNNNNSSGPTTPTLISIDASNITTTTTNVILPLSISTTTNIIATTTTTTTTTTASEQPLTPRTPKPTPPPRRDIITTKVCDEDEDDDDDDSGELEQN
ncbi:hypothetical protein ACTFIW_010513 [Dictyostelium discoideum]